MAKTQTLSFPQGASYLIPFQCRSVGASTTDWTGWRVLFVVKKQLTDGDDAALINQTIVPDPTTGYNELLLNGDETYEFPIGRYYYQAIVIDATGTVGKSEVGMFVVEETTLRANAGTYVGPNPPLNPPSTQGLIFNARQPIYLDLKLITSSGMSAAIYDPQHIQADAFNADNHTDGTTKKVFLATERTKLAGIAAGATANNTDAYLLNRTNHSGQQAISTITGLQAALDSGSGNISAHIANTNNPHAVTKAQVGLGSADNTADATKNVLSATKLTTPRTINGVSFDGTANIALVKGNIGLGNVDNTSDANKPISTATQTALNGKGALISIPQFSLPYRNAAGNGETNTSLQYSSLAATASTVVGRDVAGAIYTATGTVGAHAVNKTQMDAADAAHVAALDPHPQYVNEYRGDIRYALSPYNVMASTEFGSIVSSYGVLGPRFDNIGYTNDLNLFGKSTQASTPTVDVPVPIVSTTGNVVIRSNTKNMLAFTPGTNTTVNGVTIRYNADGSITFDGTVTTSFSITRPLVGGPQSFGGNQSVTHSLGVNPPALTYFSLDNINGTMLSNNVQTKTWNDNNTYTNYFIYLTAGAVFSNMTVRPQIEVGTVATSYVQPVRATSTVPLASIQLRSLPDGTRDRIYKSGSTWYREENVGQITIAGTESWTVSSSVGSPTFSYAYTSAYDSLITNTLFHNSTRALSNNMSTAGGMLTTSSVVTTDTVTAGTTQTVRLRFMILSSRISGNSSAAVNTFFQNNPTVVQFIRETPLTTAISGPAIIAALENIRTYTGLTNITSPTPISGSYGIDSTGTYVNRNNDTIPGYLASQQYLAALGNYSALPSTPGVYMGIPTGLSPRFTMAPATGAVRAIDNSAGTVRMVNSTSDTVQLQGDANGNFMYGPSQAATTIPHTITMNAAASGLSINKVTDMVTNFSRLRIYTDATNSYIQQEVGGTGDLGNLLMTGLANTSFGGLQLSGSSTNGVVNSYVGSSTTPGMIIHRFSGALASTSGTQYVRSADVTVNQSLTAAYTADYMNIIESTTGSGIKRIVDWRTNGTPRFIVDNLGNVSANNIVNSTTTKNVTVATSEPSSPVVGDLWVVI